MKYQFDVHEVKSDEQVAGMRVVEVTAHLMTLPLLPAKINIRNYKPQSPYVKAMKQQLTTKEGGELFNSLNTGIKVACSDLRVFEDRVVATIEDEDGEGNFQGNHTQHVVSAAQQDPVKYPGVLEGKVTLTFYVGADRQTVFQLARAANAGLNQKKNDILNYQGVFEPLFDVVEERTAKLVQKKVGDSAPSVAPYLASDLVRRLALLDNSAYPIESGKHPTRVYSGAGGVTTSFAAGAFRDQLDLLQDGIDLEALIANYIVETSGGGNSNAQRCQGIEMFGKDGEEKKHKAYTTLAGKVLTKTPSVSFVMPALSAFRVFIRNRKFIKPIGELFAEYGPAIVQAVRAQYAGEALDSFGKDKRLWKAVANQALTLAQRDGYVDVRPRARRARAS